MISAGTTFLLKPETELSSAKRALIAQWRRGRPLETESRLRVVPRLRESAPLSFGQQQLWFFDQLESNSPLYSIPIAMRLSGVMDLEALQKGFDAIVARHEVLRSRFVGNLQPVQFIDPPRAVPMQVFDLREVPAPSRDSQAQRLLEAEIRRPFDLSKDLMIRL